MLSCSPSPETSNQDVVDTYPNGFTRAEYTLINGRLEGTKREYYDNGTLKSTEEWRDSLRHGKAVYYNAEGIKIEEGGFKNNLVTGCWIKYYDSGTISSFRDYSAPDSIVASVGGKPYPVRYLDFRETGDVNFDVLSMYYELSPVDTMGERYAVLTVKCLPANTTMRIIYTHKDSTKFDTAYEDENPIAFMMKSNSDYVKGIIQCLDTIVVDGKPTYQGYESYFDSRRPTCNVPIELK